MKDFNYRELFLQWKKRLLILQEKYADTPPGFSSEEEEKVAWKVWEEEYERFIEEERPAIEDVALPAFSFPLIGRDEELAAAERILASYHTAFLYGIGGIGKTAIVLSYIAGHRSSYDHILYIVAGKGILEAVCDDAFLPISTLRYDQKRYSSRRQYFREKLDALKKISESKRMLIVIDNMNAPADRDLRQFLELSCDKIITTRINYETVPEEEKLAVGSLKTQYWPELIGVYSNNLDSSKTERLLRYGQQVKGHTLSMKMASAQASCKDAAEQPAGSHDITDLLSSFRLKKKELEALLYLSVLAPQGMEKDLFCLVSGVSEQTLTSLQNYLLIDVFGSVLRVHPLIAEAVKRILPPTCVRCSRLLRGFEEYLYGETAGIGTWHRTYEENRALEPHVLALYEAFPRPAPRLATAFEEIATFLWVQGYYEEALSYAIKIYESVMGYYGPDHVLSGREALRVAAVYHNSVDHDNALLWYQKGYELLKAAKPRNFEVMKQLSTACTKLAREYSHRRDTEAQKKYADEYRQIFQDMMGLYGANLAGHEKEAVLLQHLYFLVEEAKHALREGRVGDAQRIYASIEKWMEGREEDLAYRKAPVKELQIELLLRENRLEEAEAAARESVQTALMYRGEKYKDYLAGLETLADVLALENKTAEACSIYEKILVRLQRDYPYETKWCRNIEERIEKI